MSLRAALFAAAALPLLGASPARAQEWPWRAQLTPYVWATGLSATVRPLPGAPTVEADNSFGGWWAR